MLNKLFLFTIACFFSTFLEAKMYDIAGVVEKKDSDYLNVKLREYEKKTGIVITIITIGENDDRFYLKGVADNEVMAVISTDKKTCSVEVGKVIGVWMTDTYAYMILNRNVSVVSEKNDYAYGINMAVSSIMIKLGDQNIYDRISHIQESKIKNGKAIDIFSKTVMWGLIAIAFLLTGFFITSRINEIFRTKNNTALFIKEKDEDLTDENKVNTGDKAVVEDLKELVK
jgi:uncharacterized membrane protein YgcG